MNISFFGYSKPAEKLCRFLTKSDIEIKGIFDISLQKCVEFASIADSKAFLDINEAMEKSDIIFVNDDRQLKSYITHIRNSSYVNKIICLISSGNTSDATYTHEHNTHISVYSPCLLSDDNTKNMHLNLITEGFGINYTDFAEFLVEKHIPFTQISIDKAKELHTFINLYTNGIQTLTKILNNTLKEMNINTEDVTAQLTSLITDSSLPSGSFFTNDTYSIIRTIDSLKSLDNPKILSLYRILGLNAVNFTTLNKDEKEHLMNIIIDNKK